MEYKLDAKDLLIMYYLKNDSRMSLSNIGIELDMTPSAISYRLNKLTEGNIIKKFTIEINHEILTPTYQSYLISAKIDKKYIPDLITEFIESNYFDKILEIASSSNINAISHQLSSKQFKEFLILLKKDGIISYTITPIITNYNLQSKSIIGENIQNVYCPLCQKRISGQGIITKINDKIFSFCCEECLDEFEKNYLSIIKK